MPGLDPIDIRLLRLLQQNGRVSQHDLARSVGLSAPAVAERVRKLEERGVVQRYTAVLDPKRLGRDVTAFIAVGINGSRNFADFRKRVADRDEVVECHSVTGQGSHLLKVRVANTGALEELLAELQAWPGIQWTNTSIVLSTIKETTELGLDEDEDAGLEEKGKAGPADLLHVPFRHHP